jgi:hypothetical protein
MESHFPIGSKLECVVLDKSIWETNRTKYYKMRNKDVSKSNIPFLSLLGCDSLKPIINEKPEIGSLVVGRIDRTIPSLAPPDLMLDLRHGFFGRCCITELMEPDDWTNFPLGRCRRKSKKIKSKNIEQDEDKYEHRHNDDEIDATEK